MSIEKLHESLELVALIRTLVKEEIARAERIKDERMAMMRNAEGQPAQHRGGRPPLLTPAQDKNIAGKLAAGTHSINELAKAYKVGWGVIYSASVRGGFTPPKLPRRTVADPPSTKAARPRRTPKPIQAKPPAPNVFLSRPKP